MDATTAEPMEELLLDLPPEAIEQLEVMAAAQGCTVDELAQRLLNDGLKGLAAKQDALPIVDLAPLPLS
jgi:hypothetical protein